MWNRWWKRLATAAGCQAALLGATSVAIGQEPLPAPSPFLAPLRVPSAPEVPETPDAPPPSGDAITISRDELRRLIYEAIRDHDAKKAAAAQPASRPIDEGGPAVPVQVKTPDDLNLIVNDIISAREKAKSAADAAKKEEDRARGYTVGENLTMTARWKNGVWIETVDKAFQFHLGGRAQFDYVDNNGFNDNILFSPGGIGFNPSGENIRRARLTAEGTFYDNFNFTLEYDFANTFDTRNGVTSSLIKDAKGKTLTGKAPAYPLTSITNTPAPTDVWLEFAKLPIVGNIRVGNQKPGINMEHWESSRFLPFMERSLAFDAFIEEGNNGFSPGITAWRTIGADELAWAHVGVFKVSRNIFGYNVGDGHYRLVGRAAWVPFYADEGRFLVHVAIGSMYNGLDQGQARFRARPNERSGPSVFEPFLAFAQVNADKEAVFNPEMAINMGRWCLQGEYTAAYLYNVSNIIATPTQSNVAIPPNRTYFAQGAYLELLCFLTGEHREYNKKTASFGRVVPYRNAYWTRGEDGNNIFSSGAWQAGVRYNYLDLNNNGINGGQVNTITAGLNWFFNPNAKVQWNYDYGYRSVGAPSNDYFWAFGMRFAYDF